MLLKNILFIFTLLESVLVCFDQPSDIDSLLSLSEAKVYKNPLEAKNLALHALELAQNQKNSESVGRAQKVIGGSYYVRGDYDLALDNFLQSYQQFEKIGDTVSMSQLLSNIGLVYKNIGDFRLSLNYYNQALNLAAPEDKFTNSRLINNIGVVYKGLAQYDTAEYFFQKSLNLKKELEDLSGMSNALTNLGNVTFEQGNFNEAIDYHEKSLVIECQLESQEGIAKCMNNIGLVFLKLGRYDSAEYYAAKALSIAQKLGTKLQLQQSYEILSECFYKRAAFQQAYLYRTALMEVSDSLLNEDVARRMGKLESKLELSKKEAELEHLAAEHELARVQSEKTRTTLIIVSIFSVLLIILIVTLNYLRIKRMTAEKLAQESQYDALQKRFVETLTGPQTFELKQDLDDLNDKLVTPLTEREYDALKLSMQGLSNKEIADQLFVSDSTVKFHLRNVYNKLGVTNRKEALEYVIKKA